MAGKLVLSTLNNDTGVLATQNGMTGIAKAWVRFSVSGTTPTINNFFNVSSVTRTATGRYNLSFTVAMPNANYIVCPSAIPATDNIPASYTGFEPTYGTNTATTLFISYVSTVSSTPIDPAVGYVAIFSS
jgi:hypothetical protein